MSGLNFDWVSVYVHSAERPYFYRTPDELCFPHGVSVFHTVHPCIGRKAEVMPVHTRTRARTAVYGSRSGSVIDRRGGHASSQKTKLVSRTQLLAYQPFFLCTSRRTRHGSRQAQTPWRAHVSPAAALSKLISKPPPCGTRLGLDVVCSLTLIVV